MKSRRDFLKKSSLGLVGVTLMPNTILAQKNDIKITILHTNDTHSQIHPFKSGIYKDYGGMAERAGVINKIRQEEKNVLLLDAGDIFQGTPYFNFFGGELEFKLMSEMKYDAATIGNHDLDNGLNGLLKQLKHTNFPFLIANYDFSKTILKDKFQPFKIFVKEDIKIGVFGIGVELKGLVPQELYGKTLYQDPIEKSNYYAKYLKQNKKCDLVICLSHLGFKYKSDKISDIVVAAKSRYIDLIIGGHTHTFLDKPVEILNLDKKPVLINQVGWGGINIGRIDYHFRQNHQNKTLKKVFGNAIFVKKTF